MCKLFIRSDEAVVGHKEEAHVAVAGHSAEVVGHVVGVVHDVAVVARSAEVVVHVAVVVHDVAVAVLVSQT